MNPPRSRVLRRRIVVGWLPVLLLFVLGGSMAGCAGANDLPSTTYVAPSAVATRAPIRPPVVDPATAGGHTMNHAIPTEAEAEAAWSARPDYVRTADARTEEAYAFAIARPDVIDWMPCYCGCVAMDHRNNTDCYVKPRTAGAQVVFDEHASYCTICVDISLMAKAMTAEGRSPIDIRAAVDVTYGSIAPGTDTPLPPG